jgi:four helix bundle protein
VKSGEQAKMNFDDWLKTVPETITGDSLWKMEAYRLGLFAADICWCDVTRLMQDKRTLDLSDQLYRAVGSISANIAEGYSKSTGKDHIRFYEYALGSAQESRDWSYKARHILGEEATNHRLNFMTQTIHLLTTMIPQQRAQGTIREAGPTYEVGLGNLLSNIPLP